MRLSSPPSAGQECQYKVKIPFFNPEMGNIRVNKCIIRIEELRMETALAPNGITEPSWQS